MRTKLILATIVILLIGIHLTAGNMERYVPESIPSSLIATERSLSTFTPHEAIVMAGDADLEQQAANEGWPGDGSEESPFLIQGYSFNLFTQAIRIFNTELFWEFRDNKVEGPAGSQCATWVCNTTHGAFINNEFFNRGHSALYVDNVVDLTISGNYIHDCGTHAIEAVGLGTDCTVEDNIFENNGEAGVNFRMGLVGSTIYNNTIVNSGTYSITINLRCEENTIINNTMISSGSRSLYILKASDCTISGNNITDAGSDGLRISDANGITISENLVSDSSRCGIKLLKLTTSKVLDNTIAKSTESGIFIEEGSAITIKRNHVNASGDYGLTLDEDTTRMTVRENEFYNNGDDCQICDDGSLNTISNNFYNDWTSPDEDKDGFVDTLYNIDGTAENSDEYPLAAVGGILGTLTTTADTTTSTTADIPPSLLSPEMTALVVAGAIGIVVLVVLIIKKRT
jgi:parallel beta-helix repeat protein